MSAILLYIIYPSIYLSFYLPIYLSICLSIYLSIHLSTLLQEIFTVSRKIGAIRKIKFPQKIVFWTIHENKLPREKLNTRENKFLPFLFAYSFQVMTAILHNTT